MWSQVRQQYPNNREYWILHGKGRQVVLSITGQMAAQLAAGWREGVWRTHLLCLNMGRIRDWVMPSPGRGVMRIMNKQEVSVKGEEYELGRGSDKTVKALKTG